MLQASYQGQSNYCQSTLCQYLFLYSGSLSELFSYGHVLTSDWLRELILGVLVKSRGQWSSTMSGVRQLPAEDNRR